MDSKDTNQPTDIRHRHKVTTREKQRDIKQQRNTNWLQRDTKPRTHKVTTKTHKKTIERQNNNEESQSDNKTIQTDYKETRRDTNGLQRHKITMERWNSNKETQSNYKETKSDGFKDSQMDHKKIQNNVMLPCLAPAGEMRSLLRLSPGAHCLIISPWLWEGTVKWYFTN